MSPTAPTLKAKLNDTTRAQLLQAMPSLKERAKTLIELIDSSYFIFADRPLEIEPKAAALLTPENRELIGRLRARARGGHAVDRGNHRSRDARLCRTEQPQARRGGPAAAGGADRAHHVAGNLRRPGGAGTAGMPRPARRSGPLIRWDGRPALRHLAAHTAIRYPFIQVLLEYPASLAISCRMARAAAGFRNDLIGDFTMDAKSRRQNRNTDGRQQDLRFPDFERHRWARCHRHRQALRPGRDVHLRPRLHLHRQLPVQDHLYRRRRRHPGIPRLSDRATGRTRRLPRNLLPAALRRVADQGAKGGFRPARDPSHHGSRADGPVLPGLPPRRASDGGHGGLGRRAGRVLSRLHRHQRSDSSA